MAPQRERVDVLLPNRLSRGTVPREFEWFGPAVDRAGVRRQRGRTMTGEAVLRLSPVDAAGRSSLRQEIAIGSWLVRSLGSVDYPPQLSQLLCFDSADDPRLAVVSYRGDPLTELPERLGTASLAGASLSLLTALDLVAQVQVVHRAVTPAALLWDGAMLQLAGFAQAVKVPAPRTGAPVDPQWTGPEQAAGTGYASPADDLYSASLVLFWLHTNEKPEDPGPRAMRERLALHDELHQRLAGAFADAPEDRPAVADLLRRWRPTPVPRQRTAVLDGQDTAARRAFAALRARQRAEAHLPLLPAPVFADDADPPLRDQISSRILRRRPLAPLAVIAVLGATALILIVIAIAGVVS